MLLEKTVSLADVQLEIPTWIHTDELLKNPSVSFSDGYLHEGLMDEKYSECGDDFIESLLKTGQKAPLLVEHNYYDDSDEHSYYVVNGHHRLAVAARHNLPILVLVISSGDSVWAHWDSSESGDYPECGNRF